MTNDPEEGFQERFIHASAFSLPSNGRYFSSYPTARFRSANVTNYERIVHDGPLNLNIHARLGHYWKYIAVIITGNRVKNGTAEGRGN